MLKKCTYNSHYIAHYAQVWTDYTGVLIYTPFDSKNFDRGALQHSCAR